MTALSLLSTLAWRNLWRNPRRTLLTALALGLGLAFLLLSFGLLDGLHEQAITPIVRFNAGHIVIQATGYHDSRAPGLLLPPAFLATAHEILQADTTAQLLHGFSPRLLASGLLNSASNSSEVSLVGVLPQAEQTVSFIPHRIVEGAYLSNDSASEMVLGTALAQRLGLTVGSKVVVMTHSVQSPRTESETGSAGAMHRALFKVTGLFQTGLRAIDTHLVHLPLLTAQTWLGAANQVTQLAILLKHEHDALPVAKHLREQFTSGQAEVFTWREFMPDVVHIFWMDDAFGYVMNGCLLIMVGLGVLNTILMTVLERRYEFGVCAALGLQPQQLAALVMAESLMLAAMSILAGLAVGLAGHLYLATSGFDLRWIVESRFPTSGIIFSPIIYSRLRLERIGWAIGIVTLMNIAFSVYPAFKAARTRLPGALRVV